MEKLTIREKLCYGVGIMGNTPADAIILTYLVLFGTDVMGISPGILGVIIMIPKLAEIISNLFIMNAIDRTRTRLGTYRPWLLMTFPMAVLLVLLFAYPGFLKTSAVKLLWICLIYAILTAGAEAAYYCSYTTLVGFVTPDSGERTGLVSARVVFENIGYVAVYALIFPMLNCFGSGYRDPVSWRWMTAVFGAVMILGSLICFAGVRERVPVRQDGQEEKAVSVWQKLKYIFSSRRMRINMTVQASYLMYNYLHTTIISYYCIYCLHHEEWITWFSLICMAVMVLTALFSRAMLSRIGTGRVILLGALLAAVSSVMMPFTCTFLWNVVRLIFFAFGSGLIYLTAQADLPEIADEIAEDHPQLKQGVIFGSISSFSMLFTAAGGFLGTLVLSASRYDSALTEQTAFTTNTISYGCAAGMLLLNLLTFAAVSRYLRQMKKNTGRKDGRGTENKTEGLK